jgi:putative membrane protein
MLLHRTLSLLSAVFAWSTLLSARALAHGGEHPAARDAVQAKTSLPAGFSFDPLVLASLGLAAVVYTRGLLRLRARASGPTSAAAPATLRRRFGREASAFALGWSTLVVALVSPLDALSDVLFSAHMSQHELLMLVAAPLLVIARPWQALLAACSPRVRAGIVEQMRRPALVRAWRVLTLPLLAVAMHALVRWAWHAPPLFDAALEHEWVHGIQHATFFASAALFWWTLIEGRYGRAGYGISVLFVFGTAMHTGALGAMLTFASRTYYGHGARTAAYRLDALEDQQLAGLIMWVPTGVLFVALGLSLFAAWIGEADRRTARKQRLAAVER